MAERRISCACDACAEKLAAHDAVTPDGFCGFCARHCFPPATLDGVAQRMQLTPDARANLHENFARFGTIEPAEIRRRIAVQTGAAMAKAAAPYVTARMPRPARDFFAVLAKRLGK